MQTTKLYSHLVKDQLKTLARMLDDFDPNAKFRNLKRYPGSPLRNA